jgi:hypothetical protein
MAKNKRKLIATLTGSEPAFNGNENDNSDFESTSAETNYKRIVKSAKIIDDLTLDVKYHEQLTLISANGTKRKDISGTNSREGENAIHDDLKNAFAKLHPHLALISEMITTSANEIDDINEDAYRDFKVTGFTIGGGGDSEGVTLIGQKKLSTEKTLNITTPFTKWSDEYGFVSELAEAIESCKHEVTEYLNGKMAPPAQQEMEFEEQEDTAVN